MHLYHFVALLGTSTETDWPSLTGKDDNGIKKESRNASCIWFWRLLFSCKSATNIKQILDRKEAFDEKDCGNTGSSSGGGLCRVRHSQMEKIAEQGMKLK